MSLFSALLTVILGASSIGRSQVPAQDQCKSVEATEPPQCPQTIGPPCPPCYTNTEEDYTQGDSLTFTTDELSQINARMEQNLEYWFNEMPPDNVYPPSDPNDVIQGAAGRAFIFLRQYYYTNNQTYLDMATEYMNTALRFNPDFQTDGYSSFFHSNAGVWTMAIVLYDKLNDDTNKNVYISKLNSGYQDVINGINNGLSNSQIYNYDLTDGSVIAGLTGFLWCGMFTNKYFNDEIVNGTMIELLSYHIVDIGIQAGQNKNVDYLLYENPFTSGCYVPGAAAGFGGVIRFLLESSQTYAKGLMYPSDSSNQYYTYITNTLNFAISIQLPDGNMPTYWDDSWESTCASHFDNDSDSRVQWCHGAPGFIDIFSYAATIYQNIDVDFTNVLIKESLIVSNVTWERGLLVKGLMHCHGIGGNAFTLLHVAKNFRNLNQTNNNYDLDYYINQSIWRTNQMILWTMPQQNIDALRTQYSDEDHSAWQGSFGIPQLYIVSLQNGWADQSIPICMYAWDFCFW